MIGARIGGGYRIVEAIWDNPARGRYRGVADVEPQGRVLIATTGALRESPATLRSRLALDVDGIAPLRAIDELDVPLGPLTGLVEDEPAGAPLSRWRESGIDRGSLIVLAVRLCDVAARAHARGLVVGGFHPELIYAATTGGALALTAVAPRANELYRAGARPDAGNLPAFDMVFEPVAVAVAGVPPSARSDVFALAGVLGYLATGRHPFGGGSPMQQIDAMTRSDGGWRDLDDPLLRALEACLRRDEGGRPGAADLRDTIDRLAV